MKLYNWNSCCQCMISIFFLLLLEKIKTYNCWLEFYPRVRLSHCVEHNPLYHLFVLTPTDSSGRAHNERSGINFIKGLEEFSRLCTFCSCLKLLILTLLFFNKCLVIYEDNRKYNLFMMLECVFTLTRKLLFQVNFNTF